MTKLKVGIQQVGNIVFGKVLEQDESLRNGDGDGNLYGLVFAQGGTAVGAMRSRWFPALTTNYFHIRGNKRHDDNKWFAYPFDSAEVAKQAIKDIRMFVAQVNGATENEDNCGLEIIE